METKAWYKSLTVWGTAILSLCAVVLPALGKTDLAQFVSGEQKGTIDWLAMPGDVIGGDRAVEGGRGAHPRRPASQRGWVLAEGCAAQDKAPRKPGTHAGCALGSATVPPAEWPPSATWSRSSRPASSPFSFSACSSPRMAGRAGQDGLLP